MKIHPQAVVSSLACLGDDVEVGPFSVIESDVVIGDRCRIEGRVTIKRGTVIGNDNYICEGTVIGGLPQHVSIPESPGRVVIGDGNVIRENVTIHRALDTDNDTTIGDNNLVMVNAHVAHDCRVGNNVIIVNNAMLGGHVVVGDRAYISGAVAIHQFCRVGAFAMVGGQAHLTRDVPPYVTVDGLSSHVVGLNQIGLRRAGFRSPELAELKKAYRLIYRSGLRWNELLDTLRDEFPEGPAALFHQFLATTTRGIVPERRLPPGATLKICRREGDEATETGRDDWEAQTG
ncbi:acyl-ACP--UDP-N-acetylglucosamine O-acyltransferase [Thermostilla marina]